MEKTGEGRDKPTEGHGKSTFDSSDTTSEQGYRWVCTTVRLHTSISKHDWIKIFFPPPHLPCPTELRFMFTWKSPTRSSCTSKTRRGTQPKVLKPEHNGALFRQKQAETKQHVLSHIPQHLKPYLNETPIRSLWHSNKPLPNTVPKEQNALKR